MSIVGGGRETQPQLQKSFIYINKSNVAELIKDDCIYEHQLKHT
jgi:hypothetical protein